MLLLVFHLYVDYILQKQDYVSIQKVIHNRLDDLSDTEEYAVWSMLWTVMETEDSAVGTLGKTDSQWRDTPVFALF